MNEPGPHVPGSPRSGGRTGLPGATPVPMLWCVACHDRDQVHPAAAFRTRGQSVPATRRDRSAPVPPASATRSRGGPWAPAEVMFPAPGDGRGRAPADPLRGRQAVSLAGMRLPRPASASGAHDRPGVSLGEKALRKQEIASASRDRKRESGAGTPAQWHVAASVAEGGHPDGSSVGMPARRHAAAGGLRGRRGGSEAGMRAPGLVVPPSVAGGRRGGSGARMWAPGQVGPVRAGRGSPAAPVAEAGRHDPAPRARVVPIPATTSASVRSAMPRWRHDPAPGRSALASRRCSCGSRGTN